MKTEITPEEYKNIYEACDWNPKAFSIVLKKLGYSDELIIDDFLDFKGTPIKSLVNVKTVNDCLDLRGTPIQDLGDLKYVGGYLDLRGTSIQDLRNLQYVGRWLGLRNTPIQDLENLKFVGGDLYLKNTPISKKYSKEEIGQMVNVGGDIYL